MQNFSEARRYAINELDKSYNQIIVFVDDLVKKSNDRENMLLLQGKVYNLKMYIDSLKVLDSIPIVRGGRRTRKNRRKSLRH